MLLMPPTKRILQVHTPTKIEERDGLEVIGGSLSYLVQFHFGRFS
jgi:hypothetical protein